MKPVALPIRFLAPMLAALLPAAAAQAQELFGGVHARMTPEQIIAAVPGASVPATPAMLHGGDREHVRIHELHIGGHAFTGSVYYGENGLSQLTLNLNRRDLPPTEALATYDAVLAELAERHGPPTRSEDFLDDPQAPEREARWQATGQEIMLLYIGNSDGRGGYLSLLNVVFRPVPENEKAM